MVFAEFSDNFRTCALLSTRDSLWSVDCGPWTEFSLKFEVVTLAKFINNFRTCTLQWTIDHGLWTLHGLWTYQLISYFQEINQPL